LHDLEIEPDLLHLGPYRRRADALDGGNRAALKLADGEYTGTYWLAIDMHGAGTTLRYAASEFRAGQAENVTQDPQQGHFGRRIEGSFLTIDG
jgi:hypothetical protein